MNLEMFENLATSLKENEDVRNFLKELADNMLENIREKGVGNLEENGMNLDNLREENRLYQVVEKTEDGIYLQNTKTNEIFEETEIPNEIKDKIEEDYILRYQNGNYVIEEELTDDFLNNMVGIQEYKEIQNDFIENSGIENIDPNTRFNVISREDDYAVLGYNNNNTLEVPNALLPYFLDNETVLCYKDGKFGKDI